jgi:hypothetical protein
LDKLEESKHMSEKLSQSSEKLHSIDTSAEQQKHLEKLQEKAEAAEKDSIQQHIESLNQAAEQQAISGKELNVGDKTIESSQQTFGTTKQLKADAYKHTLKKVRGQLNVTDRAFSKVVHNKTIDTVSNAASKTVARPSAFLGGSFGALVGSAALLYISRQNGFTYNYTAIFALFVGGFFVGALIELVVKLLFRRRTS